MSSTGPSCHRVSGRAASPESARAPSKGVPICTLTVVKKLTIL